MEIMDGAELKRGLFSLMMAAFAILFLTTTAKGAVIVAEDDVQVAVDKASPGDTIMVMAGLYDPFTVDKTLTLWGFDRPEVHAMIQTPAITIDADGVVISGFDVLGVPEDPAGKFNYYMEDLSSRKPHYKLDFKNAAVLVDGNDVIVKNMKVRRAEVGILINGARNSTLKDNDFLGCEIGADLVRCRDGRIESCLFEGCNEYGARLQGSDDVWLTDNEVFNTSSAGIMLMKSSHCLVEKNEFSGNWEGVALWNASFCELKDNNADQNLYYGMVITSSSNNSIVNNSAVSTGGGEQNLMGIGISLQNNSTYNLIFGNVVEDNFNGLEAIDGCQFNVICGNYAANNRKGIRLKENQNNLIYKNTFRKNGVTARDNNSYNFWNASLGNYYDDYRGQDRNGDGIGDEPYWIPAGSSLAVDWHPLMKPFDGTIDYVASREDLIQYATYLPEEELPYKMVNETMVIGSQKPTKWWL